MKTRLSASLSSLLLGASLAACSSPNVAELCPVPTGATPAQVMDAVQACYGCTLSTVVDPRRQQDIDILFVIDNSPSMAPKQKALASALPKFMTEIQAIDANYHVGVVTTDLGINMYDGTATGIPFPAPVIPACNTAAGDDGVLQNIPCADRIGLSGEAAAACKSACPDPSYVPQNGGRYILSQDGITNIPQLMMGGIDVGPERAFQCMALVGSAGCTVSQPLEAAKRALDNHRPENQGFNRGSSQLVIIFITDQDDCSVQAAQRGLLNPATPNETSPACNTPASNVDPQCYNLGYRCLALDLACAQPMNTPGAKTGCKERTDSFLISIDKYAKFFSELPNSSIQIAGIWSPSILDNPSSDPAKDGQLLIDYDSGTLDSAHLVPGQRLDAACNNPDPMLTSDAQGFFGQPQLRLSTFIRRFSGSNIREQTICEPANYSTALDVITHNLIGTFEVNCLPSAPSMANGTPACVVGYVDASNPRSTPEVALPVCSATCCDFFATDPAPSLAEDPGLKPNPHRVAKAAACSKDPDCYCAVPSMMNCLGGAVVGIWRQGNAASPSGKVVNFQCTGGPGC